jgi:fused signal recognition particle receptor
VKFLQRLQAGLEKTRERLGARLAGLLRPGEARRLADLLEELEEILIEADVGPESASQLVEQIRREAGAGRTISGVADLKGLLARAIVALRAAPGETGGSPAWEQRPRVVFLIGVNGGGKTTTAAKLAARYAAEGKKGLLVAADTFRAAAIDQLAVWSQRVGVELIRHQEGADPSAVVFDALRAARSRGADFVIVDTAGRLHTKTPLMKELEKIYRIAGREVEGAPHEALLVIDAGTGQNGITQAREFLKAGRITGTVLTKLDGTARGGVAVGISRALGIPLRFIGVGEGVDDLLEFSVDDFVEGLLAVRPEDGERSAAPAGEAPARRTAER